MTTKTTSQEWNARFEFSRAKAIEEYSHPNTTRATIEAKRQQMLQTSKMMSSVSDTPEFAGYLVGLVFVYETKAV